MRRVSIFALWAAIAGPASAQVSTASTATVAPVIKYHPDDPRADRTGTPIGPPRTATIGPSLALDGEKRPVPDYDGREAAPMTAADVLIWVPRAIFYPAYLVMEIGVRWPLVQFITWQEREKILARATDLFSFRDGKSGLFPTAFFDFGLLPSVGFFMFNDDVLVEGHSFQLQGGFWKDDWRRLVFRDHIDVFAGNTGQIDLRVEYATRPDHLYYGEGWATHQSARTFFEHRTVDVELGFGAFLSGLNRASGLVRYRNGELGPSLKCPPGLVALSDCNGRSPSIESRFDTSELAGFEGDGYQLLSFGVALELDTRKSDRAFTDGTGLRGELHASFHVDPTNTEMNFFRWVAQGNAFLDVSGTNHVIGVQIYAGLIDETGSGGVPITELVTGGGQEILRGFLPERFRGRSVVAATLNYRYPIWILLDADLFLGVGNAFGPAFEGFAWERLVMSGGLALRSSLSRETSLDLLVGFGTNRLGDELAIDSVRFTFGANHGF